MTNGELHDSDCSDAANYDSCFVQGVQTSSIQYPEDSNFNVLVADLTAASPQSATSSFNIKVAAGLSTSDFGENQVYFAIQVFYLHPDLAADPSQPEVLTIVTKVFNTVYWCSADDILFSFPDDRKQNYQTLILTEVGVFQDYFVADSNGVNKGVEYIKLSDNDAN